MSGKAVGNKCHILWLKCTKIDFNWGSEPDPDPGPVGVAYITAGPLSCIEGTTRVQTYIIIGPSLTVGTQSVTVGEVTFDTA